MAKFDAAMKRFSVVDMRCTVGGMCHGCGDCRWVRSLSKQNHERDCSCYSPTSRLCGRCQSRASCTTFPSTTLSTQNSDSTLTVALSRWNTPAISVAVQRKTALRSLRRFACAIPTTALPAIIAAMTFVTQLELRIVHAASGAPAAVARRPYRRFAREVVGLRLNSSISVLLGAPAFTDHGCELHVAIAASSGTLCLGTVRPLLAATASKAASFPELCFLLPDISLSTIFKVA